jgi:hypothetical protein
LAEAFNQVGWELAKLDRYTQALLYCQRAVALNERNCQDLWIKIFCGRSDHGFCAQ